MSCAHLIGGIDLDGGQAGRHCAQAVYDSGDLLFEAVVVRQLDEGALRLLGAEGWGWEPAAGCWTFCRSFRSDERIDACLDAFGGGLKHRCGVRDQFAARVGGVAFLLQRLQGRRSGRRRDGAERRWRSQD